MNNEMQGEALMKDNQMIGNSPMKSNRQSQDPSLQPNEAQVGLTAEHPHPPRYPNTKLPGVVRGETQVMMDTYGIHPITPEHKEMFDYKQTHKERHGY
jgi:hypothetical protein